MKNANNYLRLKAELAADVSILRALLEKNRRATIRALNSGNADEFAWAAGAILIHNIYCLFENYFLRVSTFFENGLDATAWHAQLVERIDELRRFRHAFCNLYQTELDIERVKLLNDSIPRIIENFMPFHHRYSQALELLADESLA